MRELDTLKRKIQSSLKNWTFGKTILTVGLALIILQVMGMLSKGLIPFKIGPIVVFIILGISVTMALTIVKLRLEGQEISQKDFFLLVLMIVITALAAIYLPKIVPNLFSMLSETSAQLQSLLAIS